MTSPRDPGESLTRFVDPLIGTDSRYEFSNGNTFPAAALPFGSVHWTPLTGEGEWIYQHASKHFRGLRASHCPSVWMGDYGSFTLFPFSGDVLDDPPRSRFSRSKEDARPHRYGVRLENGVRAEAAPSMRGALLRFTFPPGARAKVLLRVEPGGGSVWVFPSKRLILGRSTYGQRGDPPGFSCHFAAVFDRPMASFGSIKGPKASPGRRSAEGAGACMYAGFDDNGGVVRVRVATSFISPERALGNLAAELPDWDFEAASSRARAAWDRVLGRIEVSGAGEAERIKLYTALYRSFLFPRVLHERRADFEADHYSPYAGGTRPGPLYGDTGFWDTYRSQFPLLTLLAPDRVGEIIEGLLNAYDEGGWIPKWPSPGYRNVMIGTHADAVIADAVHKGIRNFDAAKAYEAMRKHASRPGDERFEGRVGIEHYRRLGYVPADLVEHSVSRTQDFAYGDYCVGRMAAAIGRTAEAERFFRRSLNYRNVYDKTSGFMRGRNTDGSWVEPFDPLAWGGPYVEATAWHALWAVPHDVPGLVRLLGGRRAFAARLDAMFRAPAKMVPGSYKRVIHEMREMKAHRMGQYAHCNEPVHHVLYLYGAAGAPARGQARVREVLKRLYGTGPDGLPGDEDTGQMSAWFVLSALGFHPVCPGQPVYVLGSPLFPEARIHLPNGRTFRVRANGNSATRKYIRAARLNARTHSRTWIGHKDLLGGGELSLDMSASPGTWGSRPQNSPPGALAEGQKTQ